MPRKQNKKPASEKIFVPTGEEIDATTAAKTKLMYVIVSVLTVALVIFWFMGLKNSVQKTGEAGRLAAEAENANNQSQNINQQNTNQAVNFNQIKDDVMQQLQTGLDNKNSL
ncbi:MAG: hypothetical protein Q8L21_03190 [Candidatus Komeilibacteria bacterium]|nr:hypothetical protein [Candidatus Komeilibacteria bacterium]